MKRQRKKKMKYQLSGISCNIWPPESEFRQKVHSMVHDFKFEWFIIALIVANCICLALENPYISDGKRDTLVVFDFIFTFLFLFEMIARIIADGFIDGENSYLRDNWNRVDAFVVVVALISLGISDVAVLRAFRAVRPIRVGIRIKQVRRVINGLLVAIPGVFQVILFCFFFWFVLAVFGVHLFKGRFGRCECLLDNSTETRCWEFGTFRDNLFNEDECKAAGQRWVTHEFNYDNVFEAIMSIYKAGTMSGWWVEMYIAASMGTGENKSYQEYEWNKPAASLFFL
eukprot:UN30787